MIRNKICRKCGTELSWRTAKSGNKKGRLLSFCKKCKLERRLNKNGKKPLKPLSLCFRCGKNRRWKGSMCKSCSLEKIAKWRKDNNQICKVCKKTKCIKRFHRDKAGSKRRRTICKLCARQRNKEKRRKDPIFRYRSQLKAKYNLTPEDYRKILKSQGGLCAVCRKKPSKRFFRLHVDHDHTTKQVRGLLCQRCNTAFGLLNDDPELVKKLLEYATKKRRKEDGSPI